MELYRIINNTLVERFPDFWVDGDTVYTNNSAEEFALQSGEWHRLIVNSIPEIEEGQFVTKNYHLDDDNIVLDWVVITPSFADIDE